MTTFTQPTTMNAMVLVGHGGLEKLEYHTDWSIPAPAPTQVLIKVSACGCNNTDINTRVGWYSKNVTSATNGDAQNLKGDAFGTWGTHEIPFPRIQGADICGHVVACGTDVPVLEQQRLMNQRVIVDPWKRDWNKPDNRDNMRYIGSEYDGGFAQYAVVEHQQAHAVKSTMSDVELASFSTSYVTAENMLARANVQTDEWVLISGASGGVGSALIQLCKRRGAKVVAICAKEKQPLIAALGADVVIDRHECDSELPQRLQNLIGRNNVDVFADGVGGELFQYGIETLARTGRYTCCGAIAGPMVSFDLRTFYLNDLTFVGATTTSPNCFADLVSYIEKEEIKALVAQTFPLQELPAAQTAFLQKNHTGNIVITINQ